MSQEQMYNTYSNAISFSSIFLPRTRITLGFDTLTAVSLRISGPPRILRIQDSLRERIHSLCVREGTVKGYLRIALCRDHVTGSKDLGSQDRSKKDHAAGSYGCLIATSKTSCDKTHCQSWDCPFMTSIFKGCKGSVKKSGLSCVKEKAMD